MEPEESAAFAFLAYEYIKGQKNRKLWVHPTNAMIHRDGHLYVLYTPQRKDAAKLVNYFRMKANTMMHFSPRSRQRSNKHHNKIKTHENPLKKLAD
jgi:hypothetical protein